MSTYTQLLYQIVFSTRHREPTLIKQDRDRLFGYVTGVLKDQKCHPYRINGVNDHLHIVTHIHPTIAISDLIKDIMLSATSLMKENNLFPDFGGW